MQQSNNDDDLFAEFGQFFEKYETAEQSILAEKDSSLKRFERLVSEHIQDDLSLDVKSLAQLEILYYKIYVDKRLETKTPRAEFEQYLSLFFMKILVEKNLANWKVVKNPFSQNNFNLAIEFDDDNWTTGGFAIELYENEKDFGRRYLVEMLNNYTDGSSTR